MTVADGLAPDYQNFRWRFSAAAPSLWDDRAALRFVLYEKLGVDERTGAIAGTQFQTRHQLRTLALDLAPRSRLSATVGRHRPITTALGVNDLDGATVQWRTPGRLVQVSLFGGYAVEYWEAEFEFERPLAGGAIRVGSGVRGTSGEVSILREWNESVDGRTRAGAAGGWRGNRLTLDGRGEVDLATGILSYGRVSATAKIGTRFAPYAQVGHRRGFLFTELPGDRTGFPASSESRYTDALRDASLGATWNSIGNVSLDGRASMESGARETVGGDLWARAERLPGGFAGRVGVGAARSIWARSARGSLGAGHRLGAGRVSADLSAVGYRWRRPGLSSSTRWRFSPALGLAWPLPAGASLSLNGREILDDRGAFRTEMGIWINYRGAR
jgi:hypothetical protein